MHGKFNLNFGATVLQVSFGATDSISNGWNQTWSRQTNAKKTRRSFWPVLSTVRSTGKILNSPYFAATIDNSRLKLLDRLSDHIDSSCTKTTVAVEFDSTHCHNFQWNSECQ